MGLPDDGNLPEVVPDTSPQVLSHEEARSRAFHDQSATIIPVSYGDAPKYTHVGAGSGAEPEKTAKADGRICGLTRQALLVVLAVVLLLVAGAAIGGGVGGSKAASQKAAAASAATSAASIR